jgi:hypothetical protein
LASDPDLAKTLIKGVDHRPLAQSIAHEAELARAISKEKELCKNIVQELNLEHLAREAVRRGRFWFVFLVALVGVAYLFYRFGARSYLDNAIFQMTNQVNIDLNGVLNRTTNEVNNTLSTNIIRITNEINTTLVKTYDQLTNGIRERFEEPKIRDLVIQVATEHVTNKINRDIEQALVKAKKEVLTSTAKFSDDIQTNLNQFKTDLAASRSEAHANVSNVQEVLQLTLLSSAAIADDRKAFFDLKDILEGERRSESNIVLVQLGLSVLTQVKSRLETDREIENAMQIRIGIDPPITNLTGAQHEYLNNRENPIKRSLLLRKMFSETLLTPFERCETAAEVLRTDPSLRCVFEGCCLFKSESKSNWNIYGVPLYLDWWEKNRSNYLRKDTEARLTNAAAVRSVPK